MIRFLPSGEWLSALKATTVTGAVSLSIGQFLKLIAANSINLRPREPIYPASLAGFRRCLATVACMLHKIKAARNFHGPRLIEALPNRDVARVKGSAILDAVCLDHNGVADLKLFTAAVCKLGLEGIVSKKLNAPYRSGPSKTWIKVRNPKAPAATRAIDGAFSLRCEMSDSGKWLFNLADFRWQLDICAANPRTSCDLADS